MSNFCAVVFAYTIALSPAIYLIVKNIAIPAKTGIKKRLTIASKQVELYCVQCFRLLNKISNHSFLKMSRK
jgi:hypothetical protein